MAFQDSPPEDIRATLAISQEEARLGSRRVINLPGGRTTTVTVPAGIRDGQELRLPGQGLASNEGGAAGDLVLRISVIATDNFRHDPEDFSATQSVPKPPSLSGQAATDYAAGYSAQATLPASPPGGAYSSPIYQQAPASGPQSYPGLSPYSNAPTGQAYTPPPYPPQPLAQQQRRRSGAVTALILLLVLLLLLGSGLFFYFGYYQPNQIHSAGTATAQAHTLETVNAQASGTAQVLQATTQAGQTATVRVQATSQAYQNTYTQATQGAPTLNDPLNSQTSSQWDDSSSSSSGSCSFSGGSYHSAISTTGYFQPCYAENTNFSNFAFQIDMLIQQGDEGGIIFRADSVNDKFYLFQIDVNGNYSLYQYTNNQGGNAHRLISGTTSLMNGTGQTIQITLIAQNSNLSFYLNQHYLDSASDGSYTSGKLGVFGESVTHPTDVAFTNAKVWTL